MANYKRVFLLLLAFVMLAGILPGITLSAGAAETASGTCGENLTWKLDSSGTLTISGTGEMEQFSSHTEDYIPWYAYRGQITSVVIQEGATSVGQYAFYECVALQKVVIPESVKTINHCAFANCTSLTNVTLSEGLEIMGSYAFSKCDSLVNINLPNTLLEIRHHAFELCKALRSMEIPASVTYVDETAFGWCNSLPAIRVEMGNCCYVSDSCGVLYNIDKTELIAVPTGLSGDYIIPGSIKEVPEYAFWDCVNLESVTLSDGITTIGQNAFSGCTKLHTAVLPDSVTEMGESAFRDCSNLTRIKLSAGLTVLNNSAFYDCVNLAEITIPDGITQISYSAFSGCSSLQIVTIPISVETIEQFGFAGSNQITDIYYPGTTAQWNAINIAEDNVPLSNATIHYKAHGQHDFTAKKTTAKCTTRGFTTYSCSCGAKYVSDWTDSTWHSYASSTDSEGYITYTCSVCGDSYTSSGPRTNPEIDNNENYQNYTKWDSVTESYLLQNGDGTFVRVQATGDRVLVEQYDQNLNFLSHAEIANELPMFGGYYSNGTFHFLVFGQMNGEEDNHKEVFRVVKYSSDWTRLGCTQLYGCDTRIPFSAGSLQMISYADTLYVRTCHQLFASSDGLSHQTNYMFTVRISDMALLNTDNLSFVSHSFNQLITMDGRDVIMADHGDAHPRAIQLAKNREEILVLKIADSGSYHYNYTGASLGGLGVSKSCYLVAGNSIKQDGTVSMGGQRNIFITATSKSNFTEEGTTLRWLTSYSDGTGINVSTPHLVKISESQFCVLWTEDGILHYTFVNSSGKKTTEVFESTKGALSDCAPIYADGSIVWYVCDNDAMNFFTLDPDAPETLDVKKVIGNTITLTASNVEKTGKPVLTWNAVSGAVKYEVYRAASKDGTYTKLSTVSKTKLINSSAETGEKYYYKVRDVKADGTKGSFSNIVSRTCDLPQPEVTLSNVASSGKIKITWDSVVGAVKYQVYRSTDKENWTRLITTTGTSLTNSSSEAGKLYYYKVRALASDSAANSAFSTVKSRRCDLPRPVVTPSNIASSGKIKLTWTAVEGAKKYEVYRSTDKQNWTKLITTTGTSLTNSSAEVGKLYYYKVRAIASNSEANSAYSSVKSRRCDLPCPVITLSNVASSGKIKISWEPVEGAVKYQVYRSADKENWTRLITTTGTSLTNSSAEAGVLYYYKVRAIASNSEANSAYSSIKSRTCDLSQPVLTVELNNAGKPRLTWEAVDGAVKYRVDRSTDGENWTKLITTTGTQLTHSSAEAGITYYYRIFAISSNSAANSAYSEIVCIAAG